MNHVFLSGNLVRDPEVRYLDGGKAVTNFTIAINERGKDGKEYVSFIRCTAWGDLGIRIGDSARKGTRLTLTGKITQKTWTDKDGKKRDDVSVVVTSADVIVKSTPPTTQPQEDGLDDLPF